jgi:hypothetical protein
MIPLGFSLTYRMYELNHEHGETYASNNILTNQKALSRC